MDLLSIIVPAYNAEDTIARCIDSILAQTYPNMEIIAIDDGSYDRTPEILDAYAARHAQLRVIHSANGGVSAARNKGLDAARGSIIGFVDADDWVEPTMYQRLAELITLENADISICGHKEEHAGAKPGASGKPVYSCILFSAAEAYAAALRPEGFKGFLHNKLFRSVFFDREGYHIRLDETLHICEDLLCVCQCIAKAGSVAYEPAPLYHYTVAEGSLSNHAFSPRKVTLLDARKKIADLTKEIYPSLAGEAEFLYINNVINIFLLAIRNGADTHFLRGDIRRVRKSLRPYLRDKRNPARYRQFILVMSISLPAAKLLWKLSTRGKYKTPAV